MKPALIALALTAAAAAAPAGHAATIQWGGKVWGNDLQSDGTTPLDGSFSFELGTWAGGFLPSETNYADWNANWEPIDAVAYNETNMFFAGETQFLDTNTSLPDIQFNGQTFAQGDQVYLWGFNTKAVAPGSEWTLVTNEGGADAWTVPAADTSQESLPLSFRVSNADTPGIGDLPGPEDGGGDYTPPAGGFDIQTAAVPEPGTALLSTLALAAALRRRRR